MVGIIAAVGVACANRNRIVRQVTIKALGYTMEVDVELDNANLSLFGEKSVELNNLVIRNPMGFEADKAFSLDDVKVDVDVASFRTDTPTINLIKIHGPEITLEQGLNKSNLSELIKSATRFSQGAEAEVTAPKEESGKKVLIKKIIVDNARVAVSAPILQGKTVEVTLPRMELDELGGNKEPKPVGETIALFLSEVMKRTAESGKGILPDNLLGDMKSTLADATGRINEAREQLREKAGEALKDAGKGLGETLGGAAEDLKNLVKSPFGKDKE